MDDGCLASASHRCDSDRSTADLHVEFDVPKSLGKCGLRSLADFVAHQDANGIDLLPFVFEREQRTDFKVPGRNVDRFRKLTPIVQVTKDFPFFVAVIDDEKFAAGLAGPSGHGNRRFASRSARWWSRLMPPLATAFSGG